MGPMRASASLAVLAGVLALSPVAHAGEAAKPTTAAPAGTKPTTGAPAAKTDAVAELLAKLDKDVAAELAILADTTKPDRERVAARRKLLTDALLAKASIQALIDLGKATTDNNVRMHVALALSRVRRRGDVEPILKNYDLLKSWLNGGDGDAALRHWAAMAVVNTRTAEALETLEPMLLSPREGEDVITRAVARVLGEWRGGKSQQLAIGMLLKMVAGKTPAVRVAGVQGLQVAAKRVNVPAVVDPLAELVRSDPEEAVWRAAEAALNEITRGMAPRRLSVPTAAKPDVRERLVKVWLFEWNRAMKKAAAKPAPAKKG